MRTARDKQEHLQYAILMMSGSQRDNFLFYIATTQLVVNEIGLAAIILVVEPQLHMYILIIFLNINLLSIISHYIHQRFLQTIGKKTLKIRNYTVSNEQWEYMRGKNIPFVISLLL